MALIRCIECGGEMSDRAKVCPKCGSPGKARRSATAQPLGVSILGMIRRRKYALFGPLALSVLLILPMWKAAPDEYRASTLVKRKDLSVTSAIAGNMMVRDSDRLPVEITRAEILTWNNLERVVKQLKLDVDLRTAAQWQEEYKTLMTSIQIKEAAGEARGVDLIEIAVTDKNPKRAQSIANAITDNYVEESQRSSRDQTLGAMDFLEMQCYENLATIRKTNVELEKYTREHWTELPEVRWGILSTLQELRTTESVHLLLLSAARNRLTEIDKQVEEMDRTIKNDVQTMENSAWLELQYLLAARKKFLVALLATHARQDPIATLKEQLKKTPERVPGAIHEIINPNYQQLIKDRMSVEQEVKAQAATLQETRAQIMANEAQIRKVVDEEKQYDDIQRAHDQATKAYDQYYDSFLKVQTRSRVQSEPNTTPVEIIQRALQPALPYRSNRLALASACLMGGLAVGVMLMAFREHGTFRSVEKAAASLGVPIFGSIGAVGRAWPRTAYCREPPGTTQPAPRADDPVAEVTMRPAGPDFVRIPSCLGPSMPDVAMFYNPSGRMANEFRFLRAKLLALNGRHPPRVITVSSAALSPAKTSFALNLGAALREVDRGRVLVIAGDPLCPALQWMANAKTDSVLKDIFSKTSISEATSMNVYETAVPRLDIIPLGHPTDAPELERLLHQGWGKLLEKLRSHYSFIIIDTPPVTAASQASTFGIHSDGLILVAELGKTPRYVLAAALQTVAASGVTVLGCVFMAPRPKKRGRLFRAAKIACAVILLCAVATTLVEWIQPGGPAEVLAHIMQLMP
jgi:polysaccharide biosynthesis transport protein